MGSMAAQVQHTVEQAALDAGLRHQLPWATVTRIVDQLPVEDGCRWCSGWLERFGDGPRPTAWVCHACGRIDTDWHRQALDDSRPDRARAEEIGQKARESWRQVEERIRGRIAQRRVA